MDKQTKLRVVDHSGENGFEFEFVCDLCDFEWKSNRVQFKVCNLSRNLDEEDRYLLWEEEHNYQFNRAVSEADIEFNDCPDCRTWICGDCFFANEDEKSDFCIECIEEIKH